MVETISPVGYGGRARWGVALALHVVGATVTAAAFGAALGLIGAALRAPWGEPERRRSPPLPSCTRPASRLE